KQLRDIAAQQNITITEVSRRLERSRQYAQQLFNAQGLSFWSLERLAKAVNCQIDLVVHPSHPAPTASEVAPPPPSSSAPSETVETLAAKRAALLDKATAVLGRLADTARGRDGRISGRTSIGAKDSADTRILRKYF